MAQFSHVGAHIEGGGARGNVEMLRWYVGRRRVEGACAASLVSGEGSPDCPLGEEMGRAAVECGLGRLRMAKKANAGSRGGSKGALDSGGGGVAAGSMMWVRAGRGRRYELRRGGAKGGAEGGAAATLTWLKMFGTLASCESGGRVWTFKRSGFLRPIVTIREEGSEETYATFTPGWMTSHGRLEFADGASYEWRSRGLLMSTWRLQDSEGREVVTITARGIAGNKASVEVGEGARSARELPLLAAFAWYLLRQIQDDSAAAAAAGGAAAAAG